MQVQVQECKALDVREVEETGLLMNKHSQMFIEHNTQPAPPFPCPSSIPLLNLQLHLCVRHPQASSHPLRSAPQLVLLPRRRHRRQLRLQGAHQLPHLARNQAVAAAAASRRCGGGGGQGAGAGGGGEGGEGAGGGLRELGLRVTAAAVVIVLSALIVVRRSGMGVGVGGRDCGAVWVAVGSGVGVRCRRGVRRLPAAAAGAAGPGGATRGQWRWRLAVWRCG